MRKGIGRFLFAAIAGAVVTGGLLTAPAASADPPRPPGPPRPPTPVGAVQICKAALNAGVTGTFQFRIRGGVPNQVSVPVGRCSEPIPVIVSVVVITELPTRGVVLRRVTADPPERLGPVYLSAGQAQVTVAPRGATVVTFGNAAVRG